MCHTGILHHVAQLDSIYNIVIRRSSKLLSSALQSNSLLIREVFFPRVLSVLILAWAAMQSLVIDTRRFTKIKMSIVPILSKMPGLHLN